MRQFLVCIGLGVVPEQRSKRPSFPLRQLLMLETAQSPKILETLPLPELLNLWNGTVYGTMRSNMLFVAPILISKSPDC